MNDLCWDLALARDLYDGVLETCQPYQQNEASGVLLPGETTLFGMVIKMEPDLPPGTFIRAEDLVDGKVILYETSPHGSLKATMIGEAFRKGEQ